MRMKYPIYDTIEAKSRYSAPSEDARMWFWAELDQTTKDPTGNMGCLRAITEMEALDRLREAFPQIGQIKWITKSEY